MIWKHRGKPIPLEAYHGVPKGWYAPEIVVEHARLGGTHDIGGPEATEPGAPGWMPERNAWLQYRQTLYRIADGIRANDPACVELAVRYIELRYIGSYSGYVRSRLSRRLKHAALSEDQKQRLHRHFGGLLLDGERSIEFEEYFKLWRVFITEEQKNALLEQMTVRGGQAVAWLAANLQPNKGGQQTRRIASRGRARPSTAGRAGAIKKHR
jgi:hypothetical protein